MSQMTDPHVGLVSFQEALQDGRIHPTACNKQPQLVVLHDDAEGTPRLTYALIEGGIVKATAAYVNVEPIVGIPCFGLGYAVGEPFRKQGLAYDIVEASIDELRHGFRKHIPQFYIEAIVSVDNLASNKVASRLLTANPDSITDEVSGEPAFHYVRLIDR